VTTRNHHHLLQGSRKSGSPCLFPGGATTIIRLNLNIPQALHDQLKRAAEEEDRTMTQVLCRALRAFFATTQETETKPAPRTRKDQS
jgi:hypothetical protein